jgi:hypothetical protein
MDKIFEQMEQMVLLYERFYASKSVLTRRRSRASG